MERSKKPSAIPVSPTIPTPNVSISQDNARVTASLPTGESIEVLLYGATVISWKSVKGKENLFLSSKAHLDGSKPVRGGIPLVFPVFGPPPADHATTGLPQHGFARTTKWEYLGKSTSESSATPNSSGDASVKLDFGLSNTMLDDIPSQWKTYQFGITYSITLNKDDLETSFAIRNTGEKEWEFQTLFHTYLAVDNISTVSISGLESASYKDKTQSGKTVKATNDIITISSEVDRTYPSDPSQPIVVAEKNKPRYEVTRDMLGDVVVWNPWDAKAKSMADFGPEDGWKRMICVEAGSVGQWNTLEAGDT
ncbi:glucose-6-phosphate 1-epimerase, partial [Lecanoromycetidae sp. Uapishka_2]